MTAVTTVSTPGLECYYVAKGLLRPRYWYDPAQVGSGFPCLVGIVVFKSPSESVEKLIIQFNRRYSRLVSPPTVVSEVEASLARFFGVASPDDIEILPHAAKKTHVAEEVTPPQLAWLYRVRQIADEVIVPGYSPQAVRNALPKLDALKSAPEEARKVPRILAESGIRFVIVESLPSAKIDGVCFWLNEKSPVIGMSLRHDRIDNFWFVLRHELEHILCLHGHTAMILDAELEGERAGTGAEVSKDERIANQAAADFCVPRTRIEGFIARKAPLFAERDIIGFARTIHVHPGLVAGQLQHLTGRYDLFRKHLVKIRSAIMPSAIVDGWGNVAPVGV